MTKLLSMLVLITSQQPNFSDRQPTRLAISSHCKNVIGLLSTLALL